MRVKRFGTKYIIVERTVCTNVNRFSMLLSRNIGMNVALITADI